MGLGGNTGASAVVGQAGGPRAGSARALFTSPMSGLQGDFPPHLWLLVAVELGALAGLRRYFRRHHGG